MCTPYTYLVTFFKFLLFLEPFKKPIKTLNFKAFRGTSILGLWYHILVSCLCHVFLRKSFFFRENDNSKLFAGRNSQNWYRSVCPVFRQSIRKVRPYYTQSNLLITKFLTLLCFIKYTQKFTLRGIYNFCTKYLTFSRLSERICFILRFAAVCNTETLWRLSNKVFKINLFGKYLVISYIVRDEVYLILMHIHTLFYVWYTELTIGFECPPLNLR